jgi:hypothetical protein
MHRDDENQSKKRGAERFLKGPGSGRRDGQRRQSQ